MAALLAAGDAAAAPPALPEPVTNNAVAAIRVDDREYIVSPFGLGPGKTWRDLRAGGYPSARTCSAAFRHSRIQRVPMCTSPSRRMAC